MVFQTYELCGFLRKHFVSQFCMVPFADSKLLDFARARFTCGMLYTVCNPWQMRFIIYNFVVDIAYFIDCRLGHDLQPSAIASAPAAPMLLLPRLQCSITCIINFHSWCFLKYKSRDFNYKNSATV